MVDLVLWDGSKKDYLSLKTPITCRFNNQFSTTLRIFDFGIRSIPI